MKSIAIGICTYHHPDAVYDILGRSVQDLFDRHIDVYYYDGSDDNETGEIIESYRSMGYTNLYHLHLPDNPDRFKMVFTGEGMQRKYDFIWPCKDRCMFSKDALDTVLECINENPDAVILTLRDCKDILKKQYHDASLLYRDHACMATSINTVIYQRESILGSFQDWIYPTVFNAYYSHFFHTIAQKKDLNVYAIYGETIAIYDSDLAVSSWENNIFKVWKDDWIKVNELLPDCYAPYRAGVIKQAATIPKMFGDVERLQELHEKGILVPERMPEVEQNWEMVSNVPIDIVAEIAAGVYDQAHDMRRISSSDEFLNLTISIHHMIKNGQMDGHQIPWQSIKDYLSGRLIKKKSFSRLNIPLIVGTISDLEKLSGENLDDAEKNANYLQVVIDFLLLIEEN